MKVPGVHTNKLDNRIRVVAYLGSELGTKANRLDDPKDGSILVSRDVIFDEEKAWTWELKTQNITQNPGTFTLVGVEVNDGETTEANENSGGESPEMVKPIHSNHSHVSGTSADSDSDQFSSGPRRMRPLSDVYDEASEVDVLEDELMMLAIVEPTTYKQAAEKTEWKNAMNA